MAIVDDVLDWYSLPVAEVIPLGNRGGFSGAGLWRGESLAGPFCVRAWPPQMDAATLQGIHRLMATARQAGLDFVPAVFRLRSGQTCVACHDRLWDVTTWMPGHADFHDRPSADRIANACIALARLHNAWTDPPKAIGPCPAIDRRLATAREWTSLTATGWRPDFDVLPMDSLRFWAECAWRLLPVCLPMVADCLAPWVQSRVPLQPCLCDIWHDHVLFTGAEVTGLVDYGSVKVDNVAVDLARLLGSLAEDDVHLRETGLAAYQRLRTLTADELRLIDVLDKTGTALGAANWLRWLYYEGRHYDDREAVARRLAALVRRMERW